MIIKRKIFSKNKKEKEEVEFDYGKWNRPRVGFPKEVGILGAGLTAGAAYGGVKAGEKHVTKKVTKENIEAAKKVLVDKVKKSNEAAKKTGGKVISQEQLSKALKNKGKFLLEKHGNLREITSKSSKLAKERIKKGKIIGGLVAGIPVGLATLGAVGNEEYKNYLFKYGPRKVEVGQVKLVNKKKK